MANPPQAFTPKPTFPGAKNGTIHCSVERCGWNAAGPKEDLWPAWNEHYRMYHSQEVGIVRFAQQQQDRIWLPGRG